MNLSDPYLDCIVMEQNQLQGLTHTLEAQLLVKIPQRQHSEHDQTDRQDHQGSHKRFLPGGRSG